MGDPFQGDSWCDPNGSREVRGLVARILFPTDGATLDKKDIAVLRRLRGPYQIMMLGHRIHFWCVGHADFRAGDRHNLELGQSRAIAVRRQLDEIFGLNRFYSGSAIESRGRQHAHRESPTREQMAQDRQVEIYASRLPRRPPTDLPMERIIGRRPPRIQIREVHDRVRGPTNWGLASRTSNVIKLNSLPGDRLTNSPVAIIPTVMQLTNQLVVERAIESGLQDMRPIASWSLMDHKSGGVLIVAAIDVRKAADSVAGKLLYVTDLCGVYRNPNEAIGRWRGQPRLEAPSAPPPFGQIDYRFFWATRE